MPSRREKDPIPGLSGHMVVPTSSPSHPRGPPQSAYNICSSGCVCVTAHGWAVTKPWWVDDRCFPVPASWGLDSPSGGDLGRSVAELLRPCLESHHWRCTAIPGNRYQPIMEARSFLNLPHIARPLCASSSQCCWCWCRRSCNELSSRAVGTTEPDPTTR